MGTTNQLEEPQETTKKDEDEIKILDITVPTEVAAKDEGKDETLKKLECED